MSEINRPEDRIDAPETAKASPESLRATEARQNSIENDLDSLPGSETTKLPEQIAKPSPEVLKDGSAPASEQKGSKMVQYDANLLTEGKRETSLEYKEIKSYPAEEANKWFSDNVDPEYKPPYKAGTEVKEIELTKDTTFARVYDNKPGGSGMYGSWLVKQEDIKGMSPEQIRDKLALPNTPIYRCDVEIQKGTRLREGTAAPVESWGSGGITQYDLMGQRVGSFENEQKLEGS